MKLHNVLETLNINEMNMDQELPINGITDDSREVKKGYAFVAIPGYQVDGHTYIQEAIEKGASMIIGEEDDQQCSVPYVKTEDSRKALGLLASRFYKNPSSNKVVIGVTGTNGKTTTSHLIKHMVEKSGWACSMFGTIDYHINGKSVPGMQTTPSAPLLQKLLHESRDDVVVMEVSSHGLAQYRLEGIKFDYCIFTNLHQDHLDYHRSMEEYFSVKAKLFTMMKEKGQAIINIDDLWGQKLARKLSNQDIPLHTVGKANFSDVQIEQVDGKETSVRCRYKGEQVLLCSPLRGTHNLYNTLEAYTVARLMGLSTSEIQSALSSFEGVRGRFEVVALENNVTAVVDYAHTADSIKHILQTAKSSGANHITHVFGFRGDRDRKKRPGMLAASAEWSDSYLLTLDDLNTCSYDEMVQALETLQTNYGNENGRIIPDRTLAIEEAVLNSHSGDWILITGKGHETYQQSYHYKTATDKETVEYIYAQHQLKTYKR